MDEQGEILRMLLGEADEAQAERARALIASRPDLARFAEAAGRAVSGLGKVSELGRAFEVAPSQLERLYAQGPAASARSLREIGADVLRAIDQGVCVLFAALTRDSWSGLPGASIAGVRGGDGSRTIEFEAHALRLEVRLEPSPTRLGGYVAMGRIDGGEVERVVWRELDAEIAHEPGVDALGFFEVEVGQGRHVIELTTPQGVVRTVAIRHAPQGDAD